MNLYFDIFAGFLAIGINPSSFLYCAFVSFISLSYHFSLFAQSIFLCERYLVTREEFIRFFVYKIDHKSVLEVYLSLVSKEKNEEKNMRIEDIFGDMFDHLDDQLKVTHENSERLTLRGCLIFMLPNIKKENSADALALIYSQRSPCLPVFMTIFALTGTGITFFIKLWLIKKSGENNEQTQQDFKNYLQSGVMSIICNPLFVCSLVFGWALWIQVIFGILFATSELLSLIFAYASIANCYCIRKNIISSDEYKDLLAKVENLFEQEKGDNENEQIKEKQKKKGENENEYKPEEDIYTSNKDNNKNNNDIHMGQGDQ